jgi:outer membrane protein assembly factor BamB
MRPAFLSALLLTVNLPLAIMAAGAAKPLFWPDKNGPAYDGIVPAAEAARLPLKWNSETGENIVWKTWIWRGKATAAPVIGGDKIWFTAATEDGKTQFVYGSRPAQRQGACIMSRCLKMPAPEDLGNPLNNYAAPSPVLEADALYVHFGTYGTARHGSGHRQDRVAAAGHQCEPLPRPRFSLPSSMGELLILTFDGINRAVCHRSGQGARARRCGPLPRTTDYGDLDAEGKPTRGGDMRKAYHTPGVFVLGGAGDGGLRGLAGGLRL